MRFIAAIIVLSGIGMANPGFAVARAERSDRLKGTWKVVSYTDTSDNGTPYLPFGAHPVGQFVYTADGHFSAQVIADSTGSIPSLLPSKGFDDLTGTSLGYFGTYSMDGPAGTLTYHLQGATAPIYVRSDVSRMIRFDGNRLIITGQAVRADGHTWKWERILVRQRE